MKKTISLFLAILTVFSICTVAITSPISFKAKASSETIQEGSFIYKVISENAAITDYTDAQSTEPVVIPESLGGYPVTKIEAEAFCDCLCVSVTIPSTVTEIDATAFTCNMPNLEEITVSENNAVFSSDENGILYSKDKTVLILYPDAKADEEFTVPSYVTTVASNSFSDVKNLKKLIFPETVKTIESKACCNAVSLTYILVKQGVKYIGDSAFKDCTNLNDVNLGYDIEYIGNDAFASTSLLTNTNNYDINGTLIRSTYFLSSLYYVFGSSGCDIPYGTTIIVGGALKSATVSTIEIPTTVKYIGDGAFNGCKLLSNIIVSEYHPYYYKCDNGLILTKDMKTVVAYPMNRTDPCCVVPEGVTEIRPYALDYAMPSNKYIPSSVKTIGINGLGSDPGMIINYQGTQSQWEEIAFETDEYREKLNNATKNYSTYTSINHSIVQIDSSFSTCTEEGTEIYSCFCGYKHTKYLPKTEHTPDGEYIVIKEETCTEPEVMVKYCRDCGAVAKTSYGIIRGHSYTKTVHEVTCTEDGYTHYECTRCGYEYDGDYVKAQGHVMWDEIFTVEPTCTEDGYDCYLCDVCYIEMSEHTNIVPATGHTPGKWRIEERAECESDGVEILPCTTCGDVIDRKIIKGSHNYTEIYLAPTCTKDGGIYQYCDLCEDTVGPIRDTEPATGHTPNEYWSVQLKPTCTTDGYEVKTCKTCGEALDKRFIEKGHKYQLVEATDTCTHTINHYRCSVCNKNKYENYYFGGSHGELVEVVDFIPTCFDEAEGTRYMQCSVCGAQVGEMSRIPIPEHELTETVTQESTCISNGKMSVTCKNCDYSITKSLPLIPHVFEEPVNYVNGKYFTNHCSVCNKSFTNEGINIYLRETLTANKGTTFSLNAHEEDNISSDFIVTSDNENVVSVNPDGTVTANNLGTANVTVKINGTNVAATCKITVVNKKNYRVQWLVGEDFHTVTFVAEGNAISLPYEPVMEGCEFVGWSPEIPDCMPAYDLTFTAVFNKVTKSDTFDVTATYAPEAFNADNVTLSVAAITGDREPGGVYMVEGEYYEQIGLYNIKTVDDDSNVIQPKEGYTVTIKMAIPEEYKSRKDFLIYHRFSDGKRERLSTEDGTITVKDGYLIFKVSKFSEFEFFVPTAKIKISKLPAKLKYTYKIDELDLSGIKLTYTNVNGEDKIITDTSMMTATGFDNREPGKQTITVRYGSYSDTFEVEVSYSWWQWIIRILFFGIIWY